MVGGCFPKWNTPKIDVKTVSSVKTAMQTTTRNSFVSFESETGCKGRVWPLITAPKKKHSVVKQTIRWNVSNLKCTFWNAGEQFAESEAKYNFLSVQLPTIHMLSPQSKDKGTQPSSFIQGGAKNSLLFFLLSPIKHNKQLKCRTFFFSLMQLHEASKIFFPPNCVKSSAASVKDATTIFWRIWNHPMSTVLICWQNSAFRSFEPDAPNTLFLMFSTFFLEHRCFHI